MGSEVRVGSVIMNRKSDAIIAIKFAEDQLAFNYTLIQHSAYTS